jgi:tRNA threonylcarbamoyladenosine biosynthesis protein TsaB
MLQTTHQFKLPARKGQGLLALVRFASRGLLSIAPRTTKKGMNILALETSGLTGSVAVCVEGGPPVEIALNPAQRSAQSLFVAIQQSLHAAEIKPADVDLVAVTDGPGSFTGLRVGVVAAKMFAYAVGCKVIGVNTLEVIAADMKTDREMVTIMDAQRGELFSARWRWRSDEQLESLVPTHVIAIDHWLSTVGEDDVLLGPGLQKCRDRLVHHDLTEKSLSGPFAKHVAGIAVTTFERRGGDDPFKLVPQYFRRAAAEEQWDQKERDAVSKKS